MDPDSLLYLIKDRRSIRQWLDKPVEKEKLDKILMAGVYAPSAANSQRTKFCVIDEINLIADITKNSPPHFGKNCPNKIIAVLFELNKSHPLGLDFRKPHPYSRFIWQDTAAAMMNMMLMAEVLGLKTCWVSVSPPEFGGSEKKIVKLLNISNKYRLTSLLFLGYGNQRIDINTAKHYGVSLKRNEKECILNDLKK